MADRADFAIFVLTAEDAAGDRKRRSRIPSPNVMFEIGFLAGRIGLSRTFCVVADPGRALMPSDLAGVMFLNSPTTCGILIFELASYPNSTHC